MESAPVGTTLGRVMAEDADVGINGRMNYTLDDLEESATFRVQTDPVTQEGIVILAKVNTFIFITSYLELWRKECTPSLISIFNIYCILKQ